MFKYIASFFFLILLFLHSAFVGLWFAVAVVVVVVVVVVDIIMALGFNFNLGGEYKYM